MLFFFKMEALELTHIFMRRSIQTELGKEKRKLRSYNKRLSYTAKFLAF